MTSDLGGYLAQGVMDKIQRHVGEMRLREREQQRRR